jgi:uncharacterized membrane protein YccF (DUF307 family)
MQENALHHHLLYITVTNGSSMLVAHYTLKPYGRQVLDQNRCEIHKQKILRARSRKVVWIGSKPNNIILVLGQYN